MKLSGFGSTTNVRFFCFVLLWAGWASRRLDNAAAEGGFDGTVRSVFQPAEELNRPGFAGGLERAEP